MAVSGMTPPEPETIADGLARGYVHRPGGAFADAIVLAHGAGSNARAPLLVAVCRTFAEAGWLAIRIDLPFRQQRAPGPPFPAMQAKDREGLRAAVGVVRGMGARRVALGGHSYGGRQATMLAAEDPGVAEALLLMSYPLHPPEKPARMRTEHFPRLRTPALFVHGTKDPFGSLAEMEGAVALIPAAHRLVEAPGAGHDLKKAPLEGMVAGIRELLGS
ncbi:MAG: dienelactone hydrolase family protein [Bryobacterales bacterium]|nr:dienelactone hydrolase family protein [Bryobacterales bacterium]